jgi:hypothetical protein
MYPGGYTLGGSRTSSPTCIDPLIRGEVLWLALVFDMYPKMAFLLPLICCLVLCTT